MTNKKLRSTNSWDNYPIGAWDIPSKAVIASDGDGHGCVLFTSGPHLRYEMSEYGTTDLMDLGLDKAPLGISVWTGICTGGVFREPTDEEYYDIRRNQNPWDDNCWRTEPDYWDLPDHDWPRYETADEAVWRSLQEMTTHPAVIVIAAYTKIKINPELLNDGLTEKLLELLDESYGDPEEFEPCPITTKMKEAEEQFKKTIITEYVMRCCTEIFRKTINIKEWKEAHPENTFATGM